MKKIQLKHRHVCSQCGGTGYIKIYGIQSPCPGCNSQGHRDWMNRNIPPPGWAGAPPGWPGG